MSGATGQVLVVEDDERLGQLLVEVLRRDGYDASLERSGDAAGARILREQPALVVLDWMLPGRSGPDICRDVRGGYGGAILMLTARRADVDQIVALDLGADDFVTKPVQPRVLLARIRALLRRAGPAEPAGEPALLDVFGLRIERERVDAFWQGKPAGLTRTEWELLWLLAGRRGEIVSREELSLKVRGVPYDALDRSLDIHVSRIRKKLAELGWTAGALRAARHQGYCLGRADDGDAG